MCLLVHRSRNAIKHSPVGADDGGGGLGPFEGCRVAVPVAHVDGDVFAQRAFGGEVSCAQGLFSEDPEEAFDLVEPRGARWGVVETHVGIRREPRLDIGGAVRDELLRMTCSSRPGYWRATFLMKLRKSGPV